MKATPLAAMVAKSRTCSDGGWLDGRLQQRKRVIKKEEEREKIEKK